MSKFKITGVGLGVLQMVIGQGNLIQGRLFGLPKKIMRRRMVARLNVLSVDETLPQQQDEQQEAK